MGGGPIENNPRQKRRFLVGVKINGEWVSCFGGPEMFFFVLFVWRMLLGKWFRLLVWQKEA